MSGVLVPGMGAVLSIAESIKKDQLQQSTIILFYKKEITCTIIAHF